jgi:glucosamine--fructose-6-phosphate aminotransferase (isomerizing)
MNQYSMERSPLHQQVDTLPDLIRGMIDDLVRRTQETFPPPVCRHVERIFVTGCGDSHHAALNSELAFEQLAGLPCEPQTAMQFSRYGASFIPEARRGSNLLLGISVSGQVSRTVEAVDLGRKAGALTVAITGNKDAPLAGVSDLLLETAVPPLPDELQGMIVPGTRSYFASQLALYLLAIHLGQERGTLSKTLANKLRHELGTIADSMEETIASSDELAQKAAQDWLDADTFVYCGSGPNYGTSLFSAAKLLEASGDTAVAQDIEEWAHLQYFARQVTTPTFLISAGQRDVDRTMEIATAAKALGRRLALIAPGDSPLTQMVGNDLLFSLKDGVRDCFSPLLTSIPAILFAAYRSQLLNEPYFRAFGGGRSVEGGGGISCIRTSHRLTEVKR